MKKNLVRIVAAMLVALLALTLIPLGALAVTVHVAEQFYDHQDPKPQDMSWGGLIHPVSGPSSVTIKASDYDNYVQFSKYKFDLQGVVDGFKAYANPDKKFDPKSSVTFKQDGFAILIYTPHQHDLTCWISDGTTHWRNCTICHDQFIGQNWCQDGDEDRICNVCGGDVPYHDITAEGPDGYTITLNRDNASHRMKITAKVEAPADAQYKLHFIKVRPDGSEQEITRYKENGEFYTRMPTYPMKVVVESIQ